MSPDRPGAPAAPAVTADDVAAAAARLAGRVRRTPVLEVEPAAFGAERAAGLVLKLEQLQHTGSFKARGALNAVLTALEAGAVGGGRGIVAASGGNHGLAAAHAAREVGVRATVFVPSSSPAVKVAGIRALGAEVVVSGEHYADAHALALVRAAEGGDLLVHAFDDVAVVAGQGTVAVELAEQWAGPGGRQVDTVLVAAGGGGLVAGIATWLASVSPATRVVAVEPERAPTVHAALAAGRPVPVEVGGVAADALGAGVAGAVGFAAVRATGVVPVLVPDEAIALARQLLWDRTRCVAEPGGAAALAALTSGAYRPGPGERVAAVVCGANTDPHDLVRRG